MNWSNITAKDLHKRISKKLSLKLPPTKHRSKHPTYWYLLDEEKVFTVTMPNLHGGSGSVSKGFLKQIQRKLRLDTRQFEDLVDCPLTAKEYEEIIRNTI